MSQTTAEFIEKLRQYVESDANTLYKQLERQWSSPLAERVAKGWAIEGLKIEGYQKQIIRLSCDTNDSRFREGDLVVLHRGSTMGCVMWPLGGPDVPMVLPPASVYGWLKFS